MQNSAAGEKEPAAGVENAVRGKGGGPSPFRAFGWADVPQGSMRSLQELQWLGTLTQAVGLLAFMAAWAAAEPAYRYDRVLIGGLCGLMVAGLLAIRLMKTPVSMFLTTLVTVLLLAEAFARLAAASPASTVWCFVLGIVFSLVMAPLFFNMAQYATAFVTVWLVLSRGRWLCLSEGRDACWSMLLLGAVAVIGFFLSFSFSRLRHASARQRLALEAMAYQDSLTGLANRRRLMERLQLLQGDGRLRHAHFLMIDVDDFKQINDRSGHEHGDTVLKALAALLRAQAGPHRAVRLGGEEFGVLMETGDRHEACALARRLVDAAHALARYPADAAPASCAGLTISIGVAAGQAGDLPRDLLRRSDQALYAAKQAGKDRFMADAGAWPAPADDDAGPSSPRAWMARVDRRKPVP